MPRPSPIPEKLQLEATICPGATAQMRNEEGRNVPVKLVCRERNITEFKVIGHADEYVTIEGGGYRYRVVWSNAEYGWEAGQAAPQRVPVPGWATVGRVIHQIADEPIQLTSVEPNPVVDPRRFTGRFTVVAVFARHIEVHADGWTGRFRIELDDNFRSQWGPASDNHNARIKPAKFLERGRRIVPLDADGNQIGTTSFLVVDYDPGAFSGGTLRVVPLLGDGVAGSPIDLPAWNSEASWGIAPDDASRQQPTAGMAVRIGDHEYEIVGVDEMTKRVLAERKYQVTFRLGDPNVEIIAPNNQAAPVGSEPDRFARIGRD